MKRFTFALLIAILVSGCASTMHVKSGSQTLTGENVGKIKNGMNKEEVAAILGKPFSMSEAPPLGEFWSYTYTEIQQSRSLNPLNPVTTGGVSRGVTITFDANGKVKSVAKSENDLFQPTTVSFS
jgi:outer membrane protein assembly factor BamE (lipoprotein component of BamABCDE complex)